MDASTPLRVALVGCGYQGGIFAQAIARMPALRIVACADPNLEAAAQVAAQAGAVPAFPSVEALLRAVDVDAVIVATAHGALYECSLAAIQAGKHVLAEKPIGMDETEAAQLEEAVAGTGVCFMAGYSFRFFPALQAVHHLQQSGAVGEVHTVAGAIGIGPMSSGWRASPETGGGPLLYVGSHLVDEILWLLDDEPAEVTATARYRADTHADETTTFQIQFAHGAVAQGVVTQAVDSFFNTLEVYGREGMISLRGVEFTYTVEVTKRTLPAYAQPSLTRYLEREDLRIVMHRPQLVEFAAAIRERRQPSVTVSDGRRVLRVLDAIARSSRTGETVRIAATSPAGRSVRG